MQEIVVFSEINGILEADIVPIADWDGFDSLAQYLKQIHHANVIKKFDGPDSRVWEFELKGIKLTLHNNPYGNTLKAFDEIGKTILRKIAQDLIERLDDSSKT